MLFVDDFVDPESVESITAAVETTPSSSDRVGETVSSQVSSAIKAPCVSPSISAQTIIPLPSTAGPSFVRETEETGGIEEVTEVEESVGGGEEVFRDGEDTDSVSAEDTATTSKSSQEILGKFVDEWLQVLDKEETESVAMILCYYLMGMFSFTETKAADCAATMLNKNERTVRRWRNEVVRNNGVMPESKHGRHQRSGVMWRNEELNKKAREYVRANAHVKGRPNMTSIDFCRWVNETLLPNCTLEPGFPRKIGLESARKWLHHLWFEVLTAKKGIFIDGHERDDVVESRKFFLRKMVKLGFLHFTNAPTEDAVKALPDDIDSPTNERC